MKKKDIITVKIDGVRFPNKAYGFVDGEKVIVKNGVPGQIVSAQVIKKRGGNVEARLLEVTERSELERQGRAAVLIMRFAADVLTRL